MLATRPDLNFAVNYFSRYQHDQTEVRWKGLKRILRYIRGTLNNLNLSYSKETITEVSCFVDADYGSESDRKSTSGFLVKVLEKQSVNHEETDYSSLVIHRRVCSTTASSELIWIKNLLTDMGVADTSPPKIYEDNQSCIHLLARWEHKRLKHVDVKYNFVKNLYEKKLIIVEYLNIKHIGH